MTINYSTFGIMLARTAQNSNEFTYEQGTIIIFVYELEI